MRAIGMGLLFLVAFATTAIAQPYGRPREPARVEWDSRGWTMLGERTVNGRIDRDRIDVGRHEGRFTKLTFVVQDDDLELLDFTINFADGTRYEPRVGHYFREGARTRVFDLPPQTGGAIRNIEMKYRNIGGGGRARVQVWAFQAPLPPPPPPRPAAPQWDSRGWTLLGERTVDGRVDRDRIEVGRQEGKFTRLQLVVLDSDLELVDFEVKFANGAPWHPAMRHYFRENQRTRSIDLPNNMRGGDERTIRYIDFTYRNLPGGGRAKLQVWGLQADGRDHGDHGGGGWGGGGRVWDDRGWTMLGEQTVQGRVDRDRINVGRDEGRFSKLMIVVLDSDLELLDFEVTFGRGATWRPDMRQYFREGTRTRSIDLPGDKRSIRHIDVRYRNLPGGGRARIQVWGK